jgi:outer membrane protein OmpA-like peptidoglycan-associated protein
MRPVIPLVVAIMLLASPAQGQDAWNLGKDLVGGAATAKVQGEVNKVLLNESRKNQCSFKTDTDVLEKGCDQKSRRLANALLDAKKKLNVAGVKNFKFEVSGHTDSTGNADHNRELSARRAERVKKELMAKGIPESEIATVGMGSDRMLAKPDDTPAKKAKNRRYELQVRL